MLKEVMMFITGKGTASLSDSLSDSIVKKMQEQHARELAEQKAADDERYRKMDEEHRIREAALESRIRELEDVRNRIRIMGLPLRMAGHISIHWRKPRLHTSMRSARMMTLPDRSLLRIRKANMQEELLLMLTLPT